MGFDAAGLADRVRAGDLRALARAATVIENDSGNGRKVVAALFPHTGNATVIGITGPPGAGKSTLVDQLIRVLRSRATTVGVIAVDPTSPFSAGAILGDRIRMQGHHEDPGVFIRSVATRGKLGGTAHCTLGLILLLDAAGRDVVIVETVGVGQDEVAIAGLADITAVVLAPGWGDDVQAIKAGMMEIADVFVVNKADLPGAGQLKAEILSIQSLISSRPDVNVPPICEASASRSEGIESVWEALESVYSRKRTKQKQVTEWSQRIREMAREIIAKKISGEALARYAELVSARQLDPFSAAEELSAAACGIATENSHAD